MILVSNILYLVYRVACLFVELPRVASLSLTIAFSGYGADLIFYWYVKLTSFAIFLMSGEVGGCHHECSSEHNGGHILSLRMLLTYA